MPNNSRHPQPLTLWFAVAAAIFIASVSFAGYCTYRINSLPPDPNYGGNVRNWYRDETELLYPTYQARAYAAVGVSGIAVLILGLLLRDERRRIRSTAPPPVEGETVLAALNGALTQLTTTARSVLKAFDRQTVLTYSALLSGVALIGFGCLAKYCSYRFSRLAIPVQTSDARYGGSVDYEAIRYNNITNEYYPTYQVVAYVGILICASAFAILVMLRRQPRLAARSAAPSKPESPSGDAPSRAEG